MVEDFVGEIEGDAQDGLLEFARANLCDGVQSVRFR